MIKTETKRPADVAREALEVIEADREALDMSNWAHRLGGMVSIEPDQDPSACGTTLCAAGIISHMLGWTVTSGGEAFREGVTSHVSDVAEMAMGLSMVEGNSIWFSSDDEAINQLQRIADGGRPIVSED